MGLKYSIFLDSSSSKLFAYLEIESEVKWNDLANTDICKKWWKYMSDIMPLPDYSRNQKSFTKSSD